MAFMDSFIKNTHILEYVCVKEQEKRNGCCAPAIQQIDSPLEADKIVAPAKDDSQLATDIESIRRDISSLSERMVEYFFTIDFLWRRRYLSCIQGISDRNKEGKLRTDHS